ncbi:MAG: lytic transglycosylase domain-containing protein [Thermoanaerobaculia bacterium]
MGGGHAVRRRAAIAWALLASPAAAELVVMVDGSVLKAASYRTVDGRAEIELPVGGRLTLSLLRVDRVVDDEVVLETDPLEGVAIPLGFGEEQAVPDAPYGQLIYNIAKRYALNPEVIVAMVRAESAFDPMAESTKGALGLMQLMPATARRFGRATDELLDPELNLETGVRYVAELAGRYANDLALILAAYNAGESSVDRYRGVPPYRETRDYIRRIYSFLGVATVADADGT